MEIRRNESESAQCLFNWFIMLKYIKIFVTHFLVAFVCSKSFTIILDIHDKMEWHNNANSYQVYIKNEKKLFVLL